MSTTITPPTEIPMTMPKDGWLLLLPLLGTGVTLLLLALGIGGAATVF